MTRARRPYRLELEVLERRILFSATTLGTALPLTFNGFETAQASSFLSDPREAVIYQVHLGKGDQVNAAVNAQTAGSGLVSLLRVFNGSGQPIALDDQEGGDPHLTFQAATAGNYYIGVSSAPNDHYDPTVADSGVAGGTTGWFTLNLRLTPSAPLQPDLESASFRLGTQAVAWGDTVPVSFTVENRGGAAAGAFDVQVLASTNNQFPAATSLVLQTIHRTGLAAASADTTQSLTVTLPAAPVGFPASGPVYLGVRIQPAAIVNGGFETGNFNGWSVVAGAPLPVVTSAHAHSGTYSALLGTPGSFGSEPNAFSFIEQTFQVNAALPLLSFWHLDSTTDTTSDLQVAYLEDGAGADHFFLVQRHDSAGAWVNTTFDMTPYIGQTVTVVFYVLQNGNGRRTSMYVDDVACIAPIVNGGFETGDFTGWQTGGGQPTPVVTATLAHSGTYSALLGTPGTTGPEPNGFSYIDQTFVVSAANPTLSFWHLDRTTDSTFDVQAAYIYDAHGNFNFIFSQLRDSNGAWIHTTYDLTPFIGQTVTLYFYVFEEGNGQRTSMYVDDVSCVGAPVVSHRGSDWENLQIVLPVNASGANLSRAQADPLGPSSRVSGSITANQTAWYQFTVGGDPQRLTATVAARGGSSLVPRLALYGPNGQVLVTADGSATPGSVTQLVQYLQAGTYYLAVSAETGSGAYQLISELISASPPPELTAGKNPNTVQVVDVNGDGRPDLVYANYSDSTVSVRLGNGEGTFQSPKTFPVGYHPFTVLVADLNGDGIPDMVTPNFGVSIPGKSHIPGNTVSVLLGNGDGTFQAAQNFTVGSSPDWVAVADINGDGIPDLVTADRGTYNSKTGSFQNGTVSVLLGHGDGTFQPRQVIASTNSPRAVAVADLTGDGRPDVVIANYADAMVTVLLNTTPARATTPTFLPPGTRAVGNVPISVTTADLNGDGRLDLITANYGSNTVSVLLGNGNGTFGDVHNFTVGSRPFSVAVGDVNNDGHLDLVTPNDRDNTVSVLLGNGNGTFQAQQVFAVSNRPGPLAVADVNGDGWPDIVGPNYGANTLLDLLNNRDGTFQHPRTFATESFPQSVAVLDVNGDGKPDIVTANLGANTVSLQVGNGDGTFQAEQAIPVGHGPWGVAVADLNGDGRPDVVTANVYDGTVSVLLSNGDATFQPQETFPVGLFPVSVQVADVNGDGRPDLVVANYGDNTVSVLLGNGDGTFQAQRTFATGTSPFSVAVADVNGDGHPDLVMANYHDNSVSVLLGNGNGTFQAPRNFGTGKNPRIVVVADVNGDKRPDLIVGNVGSDSVSVLLGNGNGTFQAAQNIPAGVYSGPVAVGDVNGDGRPDLVVGNAHDNTVSVMLGNGNGTFLPQQTFAVGIQPQSVALADVNDDGRLDIVTGNAHDTKVSVLLGNGNGTFRPSNPVDGVGSPATPFVADLNGDGIPDSVVLDGTGTILFRRGLPGAASLFAPPVTINPDNPARDIALLKTGTGTEIAAIDRAVIAPNNPSFVVSLYAVALDGSISRSLAFTTPLEPTRIVAGPLTTSGLDDLVVAQTLDDRITVAFQAAPGQIGTRVTRSVGFAPSDIALVDLTGDGLRDIVVSNQGSGDVAVLLNDPTHLFTTIYRFHTTPEPEVTDPAAPNVTNPANVTSLVFPFRMVAGAFTGPGHQDLVVLNQGAHNLSVLPGDGLGGFLNPSTALTTSTSDGAIVNQKPVAVVADDFNRDGKLDLAVLMEDRNEVWIYTGHGDGTFRHTFSIPVENLSTGLTVVAGSGPGLLDLLVGNEYGDILRLVGNGDGTFRPFVNQDDAVPFVTGDFTGNGVQDVFLANQATDEALIQLRVPGTNQFRPGNFSQDRSNGLKSPGNVLLADLNGSGIDSRIIANSGSNNVLIYVPQHDGSFRQESFFVGSNPVGLAVEYTGNGTPILAVANEGSNTVSILIGQGTGDAFTMTAGPRIQVGAGPIDVAFSKTLTTDGIPDLVVTNGQAGSISVVPGIGSNGNPTGFFDDTHTTTLNFPGNPGLAQTPNLGLPDGFALTDAGAIFRFDLTDFAATVHSVFTSAPGHEVTSIDPTLVGGETTLFAGDTDGSVLLLAANGSAFNVVASANAAGLSDVSEIQVFPVGDRFEIYATQAGSSTPFVLTMPNLLLGESGPTVQIAELFSTTASTPATVAILITVPASGESATGSIAAATPGSSVLFLASAGPDVILAESNEVFLIAGMGDLNADSPNRTEGDALMDYILGVDEALPPVRGRLRQKLLEVSQAPMPGDELVAAIDQLFRELADGTRPWAPTPCERADAGPSSAREALVPTQGAVPDATGPAEPSIDINEPRFELVVASPTAAGTEATETVQPPGSDPAPLPRPPLLGDAALIELLFAGVMVCGLGQLPVNERRGRGPNVRPRQRSGRMRTRGPGDCIIPLT